MTARDGLSHHAHNCTLDKERVAVHPIGYKVNLY